MKTENGLVVALVSDTHGGSKFALLNPAVKLTDPDSGETWTPALNGFQKKLWDWYTKDIEQVMKLAAGRPVVLIHVGDPTQGNRFGKEMVSSNAADHVMIAVANLAPWLAHPNVGHVRHIVGTGLHEFNEGAASILIHQIVKATYPNVDSRVVYHALSRVGGVAFDLAHHGPHPGSRNWLRGNVLRLYTRSLMQDEIDAGKAPPAFVIRGHYHVYTSEVVTLGEHETRAIILPSWQYPYEYVRKAGQSPARVSFGMVAIEIVNGKPSEPHKFKRTIDHRTSEVLHEQGRQTGRGAAKRDRRAAHSRK